MEDVAAGVTKPCIADIKIGRQTWDPFSSPEKISAENVKIPLFQSGIPVGATWKSHFSFFPQKKYRGTKEPLGFCIPGMCIHDLASNNVLKMDKYYGRSLNTESVREGTIPSITEWIYLTRCPSYMQLFSCF